MNPTPESDRVLMDAFWVLLEDHQTPTPWNKPRPGIIPGLWCDSVQASRFYQKCPLCVAWEHLCRGLPPVLRKPTESRYRAAYGPRWRRHLRRVITEVARHRLLSTGTNSWQRVDRRIVLGP